MTIRRNLLAENFEEFVRQEVQKQSVEVIKSNSMVDELHRDMQHMKLGYDQLLRSITKQLDGLEHSLGKIEDAPSNYDIEKNVSSLRHAISEVDLSVIRLNDMMLSTCERLESLRGSQGQIERSVNTLQSMMISREQDIRRYVDQEVERALSKMNEAVVQLKNTQFKSCDSCQTAHEAVSAHQVDVKGVMQEIHAFRHDVNYNTKRIERLETHVNRLEKKG